VAKVLHDIVKLGAYKHKMGELDEPLRYHIVGNNCLSNLELAQMIAKIMGKPLKYKLQDFHKDNPAHDIHYGLQNNKIKVVDNLEQDMKEVIEWQKEHKEWI
jgi:dTDP-D-glucose 4,6-dehydratase